MSRSASVDFKGLHSVGEPEKTTSKEDGEIVTVAHGARPSLMTRLGFTAESFKQRTLDDQHNQLNKTLKTRHLNMIAIGGSIGAGLFVGSGSALANGGPLALLIDFGIIGIMMFNVVYALGELAIIYPISGGFYTYSVRFIDPSWGFAMGWNYVFQWAVVLPLELTVAAITVNWWGADVNIGVWITVFWAAIIFVNIFGVLGYAEEEFWVAILKLGTIIVFMIMALVFVCGGGPSDGLYNEYWGARVWYNPGALSNGFFGICDVFVTAAFSFSGTELVGLAAAETENPVKSLPSAVKQVFWRITLFYILGLFFVGLLVPYDDNRLLGSDQKYLDVSASPFVIASINAGIPAFASFFNVIILLAVVSIGMSGVYGGSRTLTALAEQGYAPKIFAYIDRAGRPLFSTALIMAFGALAYIAIASAGYIVFDWLLALSGLAALFTWGSICGAHIRFRQAWKRNGHTIDEIPFRAPFGVWGSYFSLLLIFLVLLAQLYTSIYGSIHNKDAKGNPAPSPQPFFKAYLALFVVLIFYAIGWIWKREGWHKLSNIDVDSGRRELDYDVLMKMRGDYDRLPWWRKVLWYMF